MAPTLLEDDWLLVDPDAYRTRLPAAGELVLTESEDGLIVKRVQEALPDSELLLAGDAPASSAHRHSATVAAGAVHGRPWFRYSPPRRIGRVR